MDIKTFTIPAIKNDDMKQFFKDIKSPEIVDELIRMAKGNPGGATVLNQLFIGVDEAEAIKDIEILDEAGIYGGNLWIGYKDVCKQDIKEFRSKLRNEDLVKQITDSRYFIDYE